MRGMGLARRSSAGVSARAMAADGRKLTGADYIDALERVSAFRRLCAELFRTRRGRFSTPTAAALPWAAETPLSRLIDGCPGRPARPRDIHRMGEHPGLPAISLPIGVSPNPVCQLGRNSSPASAQTSSRSSPSRSDDFAHHPLAASPASGPVIMNIRSPGRHFLQIPGPTRRARPYLRAISEPTIDHRGPAFVGLARSVLTGLKRVFRTNDPVVIFPASGTGAWEAALVNTLSPGDTVVMSRTGWFANRSGARWRTRLRPRTICARHRLEAWRRSHRNRGGIAGRQEPAHSRGLRGSQ